MFLRDSEVKRLKRAIKTASEAMERGDRFIDYQKEIIRLLREEIAECKEKTGGTSHT